MYFLVDIPTCDRLGLQGAEILVFSCLAFLCRDKGYWKGSYAKLAEYSLCGSRQSAMRACARLVDCEALSITDGRFVISSSNGCPFRGKPTEGAVQNGHSDVQNGQLGVQNGRTAEKESTKEKENNIKKREGNNKPSPDFLEKDSFSASPVSKIVAADFGQQHGIPVEVVGKWWYHCDEREWRHNDGTRIVNWQSSLQKWFLREKQMNMLFISGCSGGGSVAPLGGNPRKGLNEEIRKAELQRQHEEREKAEQEGVSIPENLAQRFAKFGKQK